MRCLYHHLHHLSRCVIRIELNWCGIHQVVHQFIATYCDRCGIWVSTGKSCSPADRHVPDDGCGGSLRAPVLCGPASKNSENVFFDFFVHVLALKPQRMKTEVSSARFTSNSFLVDPNFAVRCFALKKVGLSLGWPSHESCSCPCSLRFNE